MGADGGQSWLSTFCRQNAGAHFFQNNGRAGRLLMIAFDPRRQDLHDKLAETYVIPENPGPGAARLPGYATPNVLIPEDVPAKPNPDNRLLRYDIHGSSNRCRQPGIRTLEVTGWNRQAKHIPLTSEGFYFRASLSCPSCDALLPHGRETGLAHEAG